MRKITNPANWEEEGELEPVFCVKCSAPRLFHYCPYCKTRYYWVGESRGPTSLDIPSEVNRAYFVYLIRQGLKKKENHSLIYEEIMQEGKVLGYEVTAFSALIDMEMERNG